jgi:hypothetical protein
MRHTRRSRLELTDSRRFGIRSRSGAAAAIDSAVAAYLDQNQPGFSLELRDIFIMIVADGPFPHELRGRDRRTM